MRSLYAWGKTEYSHRTEVVVVRLAVCRKACVSGSIFEAEGAGEYE